MNDRAAFDQYADEYDASLAAALELSGEDRMYYARGRVHWFGECARKLGITAKQALDYGCGVGSTSPLLCEEFGLERSIGVDVSPRSIELARAREGSARCQFHLMNDFTPNAELDLAYCNGVFHHIPIAQRAGAAAYVYAALRPGGLFALWENFAMNPGTRYVMARCVFDKDAITLMPRETRNLLIRTGFEIVSTHYAFVFPRALKFLRPLEKHLAHLPLGAQYQVLARKRR